MRSLAVAAPAIDHARVSVREPVIEREDVTAILSVLLDIKGELINIRELLEDEDGEEEEEAGA